MIIVDTNAVSELMKSGKSRVVVAWFDAQVSNSLFLPTIALAELLAGVEALPPGRRKDLISADLGVLIPRWFSSRFLSFDRDAAVAYAHLINMTRKDGWNLSTFDAQIAAIAIAHGFSVATRDTKPFVAAGVEVINPWEYTPKTDD